jgi:cell division protein FtsL
MMTEATVNVVTLLALIAIVHFAVTAIIARKLTRDELAAEAAEKLQGVKFNRTAANDGFRTAA